MNVMRLIFVLTALFVWTMPAGACVVKDPSGMLNVRNAPNGLVVGVLKNGTLIVIEERRGDWVSITPYGRRSQIGPQSPASPYWRPPGASDDPVWVLYSQLDCDSVADDMNREAERQGKTPEQFAEEILRRTKPSPRTDQQLRIIASVTAGTIALEDKCKVPLTYGERVESIITGTVVGRERLAEALNELDERMKKMGASEFCLLLEKGVRGKVE
jgi:hypothetical protein